MLEQPLDKPLEKPKKLSPVEGFKEKSQYLRGEIAKELVDGKGNFSKPNVQLLKFHGTYQQDDRDSRKSVRAETGVKAFSFMVRSKIPGGKLNAAQMLAQIDMGDELGNTTLRVTTRQGLQLHGILKENLRETIHRINTIQLSTLAACGDVSRNVMCCPAPYKHNAVRTEMQQLADALSDHFCPKTRAYHELWLTNGENGEKQLVGGGTPEFEPIYGPTYLPRKFKIGVALPEDNCIDLFANDMGYLGIHRDGHIIGYNLTVGGGMGITPSAKKTFPAVAQTLCFVTPEQALDVGTAVMKVQRDFGNREDRKVARMKYLIAKMGLPAFREKVAEYYGAPLTEAHQVEISDVKDHMGWEEQGDGRWFYGLYVENGRIKDEGDFRLKTGLRVLLNELQPGLRLTAHQNILFTDLTAEQKPRVEAILSEHGVILSEKRSPVRRLSMACPALPTCALAVAESERIHPQFMDELDALLLELGLEKEVFSLHMTGCPNGCARPYNCDVGFVGKTLKKYTIYVGGSTFGTRLNYIWRDLVPEAEVITIMRPLFERFKAERLAGERFGDFCHRLGPDGIGAGPAAADEPEEAE